MLTFLPILLAASARQSTQITMDSPGWSIARVCKELSSQTGQKFEAREAITNDHVVIVVKDASLKDFMTHLADVSYGSWHLENGIEVLQRDPAKVQALKQIQEENITASLTKLQAKLAKMTDKPFDAKLLAIQLQTKFKSIGAGTQSGEGYDNQRDHKISAAALELSDLMPTAQANQAIFSEMPIPLLAQMPHDKRFVFSNHPTQLQQAFPDSCRPALDWLQAATGAWFKELNGIKAALAPSFTYLEGQSALIPASPFSDRDTFIFSIKRSASSVYRTQLAIYDPSGKLIKASSAIIGMPHDLSLAPAKENEEPFVKVPSDLQALLSLVSNPFDFKKERIKDLPADLLDRLLHPVKNDPMSLVLYPMVKLAAEETGQQVMLDGDYFILQATQTAAVGRFSLERLNVPFLNLMSVQSKDGWTDGKISSYDLFGDTELPRSALQTFMEAINQNGVDLWPFADIEGQLPLTPMFASTELGLNEFVLDALKGEPSDNVSFEGDAGEDMFHLIGLLNSGERAKAQEPKGLLVSEMNEEAKKDVFAILFDLNPNIKDSVDWRRGSAQGSILDEPTVGFVNGLPLTARLLISNRPIGIEVGSKTGDSNRTIVKTVDTIAEEIEATQKSGEVFPDLKNLYWDSGHEYSITLDIGPQWTPISGLFRFKHTPEKISDWHHFPPEVVKEIEDKLSRDSS